MLESRVSYLSSLVRSKFCRRKVFSQSPLDVDLTVYRAGGWVLDEYNKTTYITLPMVRVTRFFGAKAERGPFARLWGGGGEKL